MAVRKLEGTSKLGIPEVDREHELLGAMLSALGTALSGGGTGEIDSLLQQLADYAEVHFLSEEMLMRFYSYPGYEEHVSEHAYLIDKVLDLRERWGESPSVAARLFHEVTEWLEGHIQGMDRQLANYVRQQQAGH